MKNYLSFLFFISISLSANVLDDLIIKKKPEINQIVIELIAAGLNDQTNNRNPSLGQQICMAGGRSLSDCIGRSIGGGICMAGGRRLSDCIGRSIGGGICMAGGRRLSDCIGRSIGGGICMAGGRRFSDCIGSSIPKGICMAGGGSFNNCIGVRSVESAIEKIPFKDRTFWWDRFRDQYGNYQWRCRGGQTKQFANDSKCSGVSKDDDRWPG